MESKEILLELLKEKYNYENERRKYYDEGLNVPVTVLTIIIGGTYTLITNNSIAPYSFSSVCVIIIIILALLSLFYLWRTYFGFNRRYSSFPESDKIIERYNDLKRYYKDVVQCEEQSIDIRIKEDLEEDWRCYYLEINTNNIKVNDLRADALFEAKKYIGISISLAVLLFLLEYIKLLT